MVVGMLRFEAGTSHAGWVIHEPVDWQELATCGPRGYEADVRVLPLGEDDISERGTCPQLIPHPRAATTTPDDCFHALWEGANGIAAGAEPGFLTANSTARRSSWSTKRAALFAGTACFGVRWTTSANGAHSTRRREDQQTTNCPRLTCCGQQIAYGSSRPTSPAVTT